MATRNLAPQDPAFRGPEDERVALVYDRHRLFAEAVTAPLEDLGYRATVATSAEEASAEIARLRPTLVLVDLSLPASNGFRVGCLALVERPDAIIVGTTPIADARRVRESREAGFWGCVSKDIPLSRFMSHIQAARQGQPSQEPWHDSGSAPTSHYARPCDLLAAQLTSRELEVLALLVDGAGSGQIAEELEISWNTVRTHAQSILTKLQVHSRLEAAAVAVQQGLVPGPTASASGAA